MQFTFGTDFMGTFVPLTGLHNSFIESATKRTLHLQISVSHIGHNSFLMNLPLTSLARSGSVTVGANRPDNSISTFFCIQLELQLEIKCQHLQSSRAFNGVCATLSAIEVLLFLGSLKRHFRDEMAELITTSIASLLG